MILISDIDSTINDHWNRIKRNTINGVCSVNAFTEEEVMKDKLLPDAEAIKKYFSEWELTFLTARAAWDDGTITRKWLDKNGFSNYNLVLVNSLEDKVGWLKEHKFNLYVDDFTYNHESIPKIHFGVIDQLRNMGVIYEIYQPIGNNWYEIARKHA